MQRTCKMRTIFFFYCIVRSVQGHSNTTININTFNQKPQTPVIQITNLTMLTEQKTQTPVIQITNLTMLSERKPQTSVIQITNLTMLSEQKPQTPVIQITLVKRINIYSCI
jgi:hypothetical protein